MHVPVSYTHLDVYKRQECKLLYRYPQCYWKGDVRRNFLRKKNAFTGVKNLTITTPSQWLADQVSRSRCV